MIGHFTAKRNLYFLPPSQFKKRFRATKGLCARSDEREHSNIIWRFGWEGICSNRQSAVIWGRGVWPNRHLGWKKCYMMRHMGRGLAENIRIPSHGWRGSKIAQTTVIWYLNVPRWPFWETLIVIEKCLIVAVHKRRPHKIIKNWPPLLSVRTQYNFRKILSFIFATKSLNVCSLNGSMVLGDYWDLLLK